MDLLSSLFTSVFTMNVPAWIIIVLVIAVGLQAREMLTRYEQSCGFCNHCLMRKQYLARADEAKKEQGKRLKDHREAQKKTPEDE